MSGQPGAAVGDKLEIEIVFHCGSETVSKKISISEARAMQADGFKTLASYFSCALCCSAKAGTAACIARCLIDGNCCDGGTQNCQPVP